MENEDVVGRYVLEVERVSKSDQSGDSVSVGMLVEPTSQGFGWICYLKAKVHVPGCLWLSLMR